jgi:phospholipid/cholesterol/gamma-HCH transport system substrate-binding protein
MEISEQVDPVKLNATLNAAAQAFTGLGERFGDSLADANRIMDDLNPRMPQIRADTQAVADLADVYADASPDLWDGLDNAVTTARTINEQRGGIDAALMAAIGFSNTATESFECGGPYLVRGRRGPAPDHEAPRRLPSDDLLHDTQLRRGGPRLAKTLGGDNGYALRSYGTVLLPGNPFIYPDNLPRVNAKGGPEGRPGCCRRSRRISGRSRIW